MKHIKRITITTALLIVSLYGLMLISSKQEFVIENISLSTMTKVSQLKKLPLKQDIKGHYQVSLDLYLSAWSSKELHIIPDDELLGLKVNGHNISLSNYTKKQLRNYKQGIRIHIEQLNKNEKNHVVLSLINASNPAGLNIKPGYNTTLLGSAVIFISLLILIYALRRHLKLSSIQYTFLFLGILASLIYLSQTNTHTRTFDVYEGGGHRDYIEYLIEHRKAPPPGEGWEYHQPPLYYVIAALTKTVLPVDTLRGDAWGQLLALWFWVIFLVACLATLKVSIKKSTVALAIASAAICLWPSGIIHSIRLSNDIPLYAFYALAFYYTLRWWNKRSTADLWYASIWASLALLTKSNALAIWGVLGILIIIQAVRLLKHRRTRVDCMAKVWRSFLIPGFCFILSMGLNFGDNIWHYAQGNSKDWLLSNVSQSINSRLKVGNTPINYLIFDTATFIRRPFISTWNDEFGRQYFWNFLLRSSLTSEFFFDSNAIAAWGVANGIFLLMLLTGIIIYTIQQGTLLSQFHWRISIYQNLPWLMAIIMPLLLLLAYRIKAPLSCHADFRFIYPALLPVFFFSTKVWKLPRFRMVRCLAIGTPLIVISTWVWLGLLVTH